MGKVFIFTFIWFCTTQVHQGRLSENEARRYFQQLIDAVAHCHSKGVYHRDLKVNNHTKQVACFIRRFMMSCFDLNKLFACAA